MSAQSDAPKVFISYCWQPFLHKQRVIELAERLVSNGVHVVIDVWDLREGQDNHQFMEKMVTDPSIKRVLLICTKIYKEKADGRTGGVGTESLIMSSDIYGKAEQTKFIPLVFESDEQNKPYLPIFVHGRFYLDFQHEETFEASYEQLLRNIFDKPTHKRPGLGLRPGYLNEQEPVFLPTAHLVKTIQAAFANERKNAPLLVKDYYQAVLRALHDFAPKENEFTTTNFVELTLGRMEQMTPLRDDFIAFLEMYSGAVPVLDEEALHDFFELLAQYFADTSAARADRSLGSIQYDYLRFFTYELLLYFVAALLRKGCFSAIGAVLHDSFIISQEYSAVQEENFLIFNAFNFTLNEEFNKKFQSTRSRVAGDKVKERVRGGYSFDELQQADVLIHFISVLNWAKAVNPNTRLWQPDTTVYHARKRPFFDRLASARYFEKAKAVFNVSTKDELLQAIALVETNTHLQNCYSHLRQMHDGLPNVVNALGAQKIATVK